MQTKYNQPIEYTLAKTFLAISIVGVAILPAVSGNLMKSLPKLPFTNMSNSTTTTQSDKGAYYLLWKQEGTGCQNWAADTANKGGKYFTCLGITQQAWSRYLRNNQGLGLPERVEVAWRQLGDSGFKVHATKIYDEQYCKPIDCFNLPSPVKEVAIAISANGGPGTAKRHLRNTEHIPNAKDRAKAIANAEKTRYFDIVARNPSQRQFLSVVNGELRGGWGNNIREREKFIEKF